MPINSAIPMTTDSVLSISMIIVALFTHHKAVTPPNPPPEHAVVRPYIGWLDKMLSRSMLPWLAKTVIWIFGITEVAGILSRLDVAQSSWMYSNSQQARVPRHMNANAWLLTGTTLIISGGVLRWSCFRALGKLFTFEVSVQKDHKLITRGAYGVVRHPSYSGILMMYAGIFIWQSGSPYSCTRQVFLGDTFVLGVRGKVLLAGLAMGCAAVGARIRTEDTILLNEFGDQWRRWAERVPYALVPYVF
ncbi:hypothetical protein BT96DRAFT_879183 [Gymnopus androsaceus JB14]|uniref:Uncharacterized protein n=1 Tax=Gymnopus androsaceus JB14 TaxID=1447944 RepID=A0A6A4HWS7_9AGAR|nr:hypothetical protein BT96DRAFT_879183 [Gymnopus androsaceus JB14]